MTTNFDRIRAYYSDFNEWGRLDTPAGQLEFEILRSILTEQIPAGSNVLDLGGGPGRYAFFLASLGHSVCLADLSEDLIEEARKRASSLDPDIRQNVVRIDVANALDLSQYDDEMFSTILLFGPLYHLMKHEVIKCLEEVRKKLQPGGTVFAVYMPYEVGVKSILERALSSPDQVDGANLERLIKSGHFRNHAIQGFQEAYFPRTSQITDYFERTGYVVEDTRSIRGIGYGNDEGIMELQDSNPARFAKILATINDTARLESVVNTGGHALITARIA